ncbi:MAG: hypothetical protein K0B01_05680 [Syntrophobacterales bacterium]|nr:hypothetical protein [Syntrophobacterales bacterium]
MKTLSDPQRVKLEKMLQKRTRCICEVHAAPGRRWPGGGLSANYSLTDGGSSTDATNLPVNMMHRFADAPEIRELLKRS